MILRAVDGLTRFLLTAAEAYERHHHAHAVDRGVVLFARLRNVARL